MRFSLLTALLATGFVFTNVPVAAQTLYAPTSGLFGTAGLGVGPSWTRASTNVGFRLSPHFDGALEVGVLDLAGIGGRVGYTSPYLIERWGIRAEAAMLGWRWGRVNQDEFPYAEFDGELRLGLYNVIMPSRPTHYVLQFGVRSASSYRNLTGSKRRAYAALGVVFQNRFVIEPSIESDVVGLTVRYNR